MQPTLQSKYYKKTILMANGSLEWDVIQDIKRLDEVIHLHDQGMVPKENIKLDRYI